MNRYYKTLIDNNVSKIKKLHTILLKEDIIDNFLDCHKRAEIPYLPLSLESNNFNITVSYDPSRLTLLQESDSLKIEYIWEKLDFRIKNIRFFEDFKNVTNIKITKKDENNIKWVFNNQQVVILIPTTKNSDDETNTAYLNNSYRYAVKLNFVSVFYDDDKNASLTVSEDVYKDLLEKNKTLVNTPYYFFYHLSSLESNLYRPIADSLFGGKKFPQEASDFMSIMKDIALNPDTAYFLDVNTIEIENISINNKKTNFKLN